jgi:hypothetical protein
MAVSHPERQAFLSALDELRELIRATDAEDEFDDVLVPIELARLLNERGRSLLTNYTKLKEAVDVIAGPLGEMFGVLQNAQR